MRPGRRDAPASSWWHRSSPAECLVRPRRGGVLEGRDNGPSNYRLILRRPTVQRRRSTLLKISSKPIAAFSTTTTERITFTVTFQFSCCNVVYLRFSCISAVKCLDFIFLLPLHVSTFTDVVRHEAKTPNYSYFLKFLQKSSMHI